MGARMAAENKVENAEVALEFELRVLYLHIFYGTAFNQGESGVGELYEHTVPKSLGCRANKKLWPKCSSIFDR